MDFISVWITLGGRKEKCPSSVAWVVVAHVTARPLSVTYFVSQQCNKKTNFSCQPGLRFSFIYCGIGKALVSKV